MSSSCSQKNKTVPRYSCKQVAGIGDLVTPRPKVFATEYKKVYLVIRLEEDYEGFESYNDFLDGLEKTRENFVWYAILLSPSGKMIFEKLSYLKKIKDLDN